MERLEKELTTREAKLAEQGELVSALRVDVSETALNAQVAIDNLREDLAVSAELLRASQVNARQLSICCSELSYLGNCRSTSGGLRVDLKNPAQLKRVSWIISLHQRQIVLAFANEVPKHCLPQSASSAMTAQTPDFATPMIFKDLKKSTFGWCLGVTSNHD